MFHKIINKTSKGPTILVVPLDWGLGHATRCIPIIKELQLQGCKVIVAAEFASKSLLEHEFQQLTFIDLPGYRIRYTANRFWMPLKIVQQIPRILYRVLYEHMWLKKVEKKHFINAVFADNRFGLYKKSIPTIYITHQLLIKTGNSFSEKILQIIHFWFIKRFSYCWIPDFEGKINIAGELSHSSKIPRNASYIGCLSRFEKQPVTLKKFNLLIIISGPEPQRKIFENLILSQLTNQHGNVLLVRGLPGTRDENKSILNTAYPDNVVIKNHLAAKELNEAIESAEWVISRSGYTTVMDLIKLQQKAILVPTPGQTEQEYLAAHLMEHHFFYAAKQEGFVLNNELKHATNFSFRIPSFDMELYKKFIAQFVQSL